MLRTNPKSVIRYTRCVLSSEEQQTHNPLVKHATSSTLLTIILLSFVTTVTV